MVELTDWPSVEVYIMDYLQVIHRGKRMSFSDIIGQDWAIRLLQSGIRNGRLAHAYLFAGPDGVGKLMVALTLAKVLNCKTPIFADCCDQCSPCRKIDVSSHPDVRLIRPSPGSIKIEQMRDLQREAFFKSFEARKKVYIIDSAELMTHEAANSLLKTLEEPPGEAMFVLTTSNVAGVPPTIVSRCQLIRFNSISRDKIEDILVNRRGLARDVAHRASLLCGGSVNQALRVGDGLAMARRNQVLDLVARVSSSDVGSIFELASGLTEHKEHLDEVLDIILSWYRDVLILKESGEGSSILNSDRMGLLEDEAGKFSTEDLVKAIGLVRQTQGYIKKNVNLQLAIEVMLLKLRGVNRSTEISSMKR